MQHNLGILVLVNASSPAYPQGMEYVLPYLDHFGAPYTLCDLQRAPLPATLDGYSLALIAHEQIDPAGHQLDWGRLLAAVRGGLGLVAFDSMKGASPAHLAGQSAPCTLLTCAADASLIPAGATGIVFAEEHPITARHAPGETIAFAHPVSCADGQAFLSVSTLEAGRMVRWVSNEWMNTHILGPLSGLDDVLWRSLVWAGQAAGRPFVLRGLPPLVTMRVDDVAGIGGLWGRSPLYWVKLANRYGFKPWLGLFLYNLSQETVAELRDLLLNGDATAFPHAFGRPPRPGAPNAQGLTYFVPGDQPLDSVLRSPVYDEFIYFDHHRACPWPDDEAARGLQAVDDWYAAHAPLPLSSYAIAHWGEMGRNVLAHVRQRWNCEFIATYHGPDAPLLGSPWLVGGPFRSYEQPGSALFDRAARGSRPVYYADFVNFADQQFFLCFTEIRDETGYEWAPNGDAPASAGRGLRQLRRALDSMALPVLFTHETDYIYKISPEAWEAQLAQIAAGLAPYHPIFVTLDEGVRYVRAVKTSRLASAIYDPAAASVAVRFAGRADLPTHFHLFTSDLASRLVEIPPFDGEIVVEVKLG